MPGSSRIMASVAEYLCNQAGWGCEIVNGTWKCIYAKDDAEFDKLFKEMTESAKAYGYDDCIRFSEEQAETRYLAEQILSANS